MYVPEQLFYIYCEGGQLCSAMRFLRHWGVRPFGSANDYTRAQIAAFLWWVYSK